MRDYLTQIKKENQNNFPPRTTFSFLTGGWERSEWQCKGKNHGSKGQEFAEINYRLPLLNSNYLGKGRVYYVEAHMPWGEHLRLRPWLRNQNQGLKCHQDLHFSIFQIDFPHITGHGHQQPPHHTSFHGFSCREGYISCPLLYWGIIDMYYCVSVRVYNVMIWYIFIVKWLPQ